MPQSCAVTTRDGDMLWIVNAMPQLYPLRTDPRYQAMLRRIGMPEAPRR